MAVELFAHNQRAFLSVEEMLANAGKAAVIHPTGTGKSYIAFKLIETHPDCQFIWLSPSEYIFRTQKEALCRSNPEMALENVQFFTYAKLMLMPLEQIASLKPAYIILDEFHRCGADRWGEGVRVLIQKNPQAKLLGLSATNIRYLDNQRDIAQELFDGCVASEMTLGEAVVRGILPRPKYVTTVFKYQQVLEQYQNRIWNLKNAALRDANQTLYDSLRRALEQADGLDGILQRHITNPQGKYLVFCSNFEHLQEMRDSTIPWFQNINPKVHSYVAYSNAPETSMAFRDFKADDSDALKLLFCIDMLNEGVHVQSISGVILFRPTLSPIIYKQQIGRALTSGDKGTPLILDVVNNFEGLSSIAAIQKEMEDAVSRLRENGEADAIFAERFQVEEQVHDCAALFQQLEDSLSTPWNHYYREAAEFYAENNHLNIPKNYDTPSGLHLGQWLCTQRMLYHNSRYRLTADQVQKLEAIGMVWQRMDDLSWERNFEAALAYFTKHGHLRVPARYVTEDGLRLGKWISNLRSQYRNNTSLTDEEIVMMESIGMVWDELEAKWQHHYTHAVVYYQTHGNLQVPTNYLAEDGFELGKWIASLRNLRRNNPQGRLTQRQIEMLDDIEMQWSSQKDTLWLQGYKVAEAYYKENGHLNISCTYKTPEGFALGKWLSRQQYAYRNPEKSNAKLSPERIQLLESIGISWSSKTEKHNRAG